MASLPPLRVLLLSDLHFTSKGAPPIASPDAKLKVANIKEFAGDLTEAEFFTYFRQLLANLGTEDHWPKAVIVAGDIVDKGGTDAGEFDRAVEFLRRLARDLRITEERIFVVPGNHDVDWSPGLPQAGRFRKFFEHTASFVTPELDGETLTPRRIDLHHIREDMPVELTLLSSPTFSGILDPAVDVLVAKLREVIDHLDPGVRDQILTAVGDSPSFLDIALVGGHQRAHLERTLDPNPENTIRIAVLHHHLLPDPQIEIAQFESVLDAGKVLERLIHFQYDLVLNGHKHNRRLAHYHLGNKVLDVYTSPSLFDRYQPGFTILEVNGPGASSYVSLHHYDYHSKQLLPHDELLRNGRVNRELTHRASQIPPETQTRVVIPILGSVRDSARFEEPAIQAFFDQAWERIVEDAQRLEKQLLRFRPPQLWPQWRRLIETLGNDAGIRVVSDRDLGFWKDAERPLTDASYYTSALAGFPGTKTRLLILDEASLRSAQSLADIDRAIERMIAQQFRVLVTPYEMVAQLLPGVDRDFGLLGGLAMYKFHGLNSLSRVLEVHFDRCEVEKACDSWHDLYALRQWDSCPENHGEVTFVDWVRAQIGPALA